MMRKRAVSLILCLCMALSLLPIPTLAVESDADADVMATVFSNDSSRQDEREPEAATQICFIDEFGRVSYKPQIHASKTADSQEERPSLMAPTSKLAPPTNLKWETQSRTYYEQQDYGNLRVDICVGTNSWTDTVNNTREYEVEIYNENGDSVCRNGHVFYHLSGNPTDFHSDDFLTKVEESGTYRFSVRAINTIDRNLSSDPAYSDTWVYTKPSEKLSTPTGITIDGDALKWSMIPNADGYEVECAYSETVTGEKSWRGSFLNRNGNTLTESDISYLLTVDEDEVRYGYDGRYHHFHVRSLSNDITQICNSQWSAYVIYDCIAGTVVQGEDIPDDNVDPESSYVSFYPENGATYDFENPSNGTSSTNYEDGKLRIFFNKEVASVSGRAQLDFSVGTLQIHRASDNQAVYALSESPTTPGVSTNCSLWGTSSPYQAVRLENVQPNLTRGTEYYVTIPEGFFKFSDGTHCSELVKGAWTFETPAEIDCYQPLEQMGDFKFRSMIATDKDGVEHDMSYYYKYDENWFLKDSTEYQHGLVQMSIRAAMAAYGTDDTASTAKNIKSLMEQLQFNQVDDIQDSYETPAKDSIGYAIGSKNIVSPTGEKFALLMVAVRGGGYYDEWGGNFTVGTGEDHEGFALAAGKVLNGIQSYINTHKSSLVTKKKIWIMGYSRGAAVTNLVAKNLDDGFVSGVLPKDIYAFCFECPQNTKDPKYSSAKYENIVSVVNPIDIVPKVAMSAWGFKRYGKTYYTPYKAGWVGGKYSKVEKKMVEEYQKLLDLDKNTSLMSDLREKWGLPKFGENLDELLPRDSTLLIPGHLQKVPFIQQATALDTLTDVLADALESQSTFTNSLQDDLVSRLVQIQYDTRTNSGQKQSALSTINEILNFINKLPDKTQKTVRTILFAGIISTVSNPAQTCEIFIYGKKFGEVSLSDIKLAHYAELCMAWLDSLSGNYEYDFSAPKYRLVYINCPVDVAVYDSNGTLVGNILDDVVQDIEDGVVAYIDADGQKVITLPIDEEYKVDITATSDGSMTYTATEYSMDTASTENLVSYHDIAVEEGTQLTGTVGKMEDDAVTTYSLTKGEEELTPDVSVSGDGVKEYTVTVNKSGNGNAIGGGKYLSGEFSQVTATANSGETFLGWYRGDAQLSTDSEYRFCVTEDMTITAKFTSNTSDSGNTPSGSGISGGSGGSGSGGGSHSESYSITVPSKSQGGQVVSDSSSAKSGKIVTLTVTPDNGYELDSLSVKYGKNKEVALEDKGNGEYTFSMPARNVTVEVLFKASPQDTMPPDTGDTDMESQPNEPIQTNPFSDVMESAYYYDAVMWAVANNVTNGRTPTTFEPGMSCTRAQTVTFLWRAAGSPEPVSNKSPFSDISENAYFYKAVLWAVEQGVTKGTTVTTFSPDNTVSRAQVVTFLYRSANSPSIVNGDNPFTDVTQSSYYHDAVTWASENGVTQGKTSTTFNPSEDCNRGQIVTFLYRHFVR